MFFPWSASLEQDIELGAIQLPGRESRLRESPHRDLCRLVGQLADEVIPYLVTPFALFGHSVGALIAFELIRELRRRAQAQPIHLFVSGCPAPHLACNRSPIHALPEPELIAALRCYNGTPEEILHNRELIDALLPVVRADLCLADTYKFHEELPLDIPISAYGGVADADVTCDGLAAWSRFTAAAFCVRLFPADHFYLSRHREMLLETLSGELSVFRS